MSRSTPGLHACRHVLAGLGLTRHAGLVQIAWILNKCSTPDPVGFVIG